MPAFRPHTHEYTDGVCDHCGALDPEVANGISEAKHRMENTDADCEHRYTRVVEYESRDFDTGAVYLGTVEYCRDCGKRV